LKDRCRGAAYGHTSPDDFSPTSAEPAISGERRKMAKGQGGGETSYGFKEVGRGYLIKTKEEVGREQKCFSKQQISSQDRQHRDD